MSETELFDEWPERYEEWFSAPIGKLVLKFESELVSEFLAPAWGETILDAGCGTGVFTTDFLAAGAKVTGVDISVPMLKYALKKTADYAFSAVRSDIRWLPFRDNSFDKAVSITALEFVPEAKLVVDELFRVVRPGGWVVVATLNSLSPWAARRRAEADSSEENIFKNAFFRSPDEILAYSSHRGIARTVIHFASDEDPAEAVKIEKAGQARGLNTGAFVAVRWQKPD